MGRHDLGCQRTRASAAARMQPAGDVCKALQVTKGASENALDVIPELVIILNGIVLGVSYDHAPDSIAWGYIEVLFTMFFTVELVMRDYYQGIKRDILAWGVFDFIVLCLAYGDLFLTHLYSLVSPTVAVDLQG